MSDESRRTYIRPFSIITARPDDEPLRCLRINRDWLPALQGMVEVWRYPERWLGTLDENRQAREDVSRLLAMLVEAEENCMDCCDDEIFDPKQSRVAADGWNMEVSNDAGNTWFPSPSDPRLGLVLPLPHVPTGDPDIDRCAAANNEIESLQDAVDQFADSQGTIIEIAVAALTILLATIFLSPAALAVLLPFIYLVARAVAQLGGTGYRNIFTEESWAQTRCALFCALDDAGHLSPAGFNQFLTNIQSMVDGGSDPLAAQQNILSMVRTQGYAVTLLNITFGSHNPDGCETCDCEPTCDVSGWTLRADPRGTINSQSSSEIVATGELVPGFGYYLQLKSASSLDCCPLSYETLSGSIGSVAVKACGNTDQDGETGWIFSYPGGYTVNVISFIASAAFQVRIFPTS
jgi:hypothetical protein